MIRVQIPPSLGRYAGNHETLELPGSTVADVLTALRHRYPELGRHLVQQDGRPRSYVNLYVNNEDIRSLAQLQTPLRDEDVLTVVPSIAGG